MTNEKTTTQPIEPVTITVIRGTGDGLAAPLTTGTVASTPDHQPNIVIKAVAPLVAILVRFGHLFFKSMVGFLTMSMVPAGDNRVMQAIHAVDLVTLIWTAAGIAVAPAAYGLITDLVTIFGKLENKYPLSTGSV